MVLAAKFNFVYVGSELFHSEANRQKLLEGVFKADDCQCGEWYDRNFEELSRVEAECSPRGILFDTAAVD